MKFSDARMHVDLIAANKRAVQELTEIVADFVKTTRIEVGMTQAMFAEEIGLDKGYIRDLEKGLYQWQPGHLRAAIDVLEEFSRAK